MLGDLMDASRALFRSVRLRTDIVRSAVRVFQECCHTQKTFRLGVKVDNQQISLHKKNGCG